MLGVHRGLGLPSCDLRTGPSRPSFTDHRDETYKHGLARSWEQCLSSSSPSHHTPEPWGAAFLLPSDIQNACERILTSKLYPNIAWMAWIKYSIRKHPGLRNTSSPFLSLVARQWGHRGTPMISNSLLVAHHSTSLGRPVILSQQPQMRGSKLSTLWHFYYWK